LRVAALYDIHGNLPALEAVLAEIEFEPPDVILFGGDIVSGPLPSETLQLVRSLDNAVCVRGNADELASPRPDPKIEAEVRWVEAQLDEEQIRWLAGLPFSWSADDTLFVHATPRSIEEIVTPATPHERLAEILAGVEESLVVAGHTHMQDDRRVDRWRFVNPGSVGMPYEDRPGAYWAILGDDIELRRTDYDLEAAAERISASGSSMAEEFATENVLTVPSREEAIAAFEPSVAEPGER
jgi:putative phosphoesterase